MNSFTSSIEDKSKRRDKLSIIAEIIDIAKEGALKTQIMYKANLSFTQLGDYLAFMSNTELLEKFDASGREVYGATKKGLNFLERHSELVELINGCETGKNGVKLPHKFFMRKN
jgi:predicted transcriptional regulator